MPSQPASEPTREAVVNQSALPCRDDLMRSLVERLAEICNPMGQAGGSNAEEIIFDVEVQDFRYLLVRLPRSDRLPTKLSPREQEIVRMVAQGHPNKVIAAVLNISSWTVCTHLRRIFAKLGVTSRAAMVARLLEQDVIHGRAKVSSQGPTVSAGLTGSTTVPAPGEPKLNTRMHGRDPCLRRAG